MKITVKPRQTLSDIAVQVYGDESAVVLLALTNNVSITQTLAPGTVLEAPEQMFDRQMQNYVTLNDISPATAELSKN